MKVGFHPTFSRHAKINTSFILVIWLIENVHVRAATSSCRNIYFTKFAL